MKGDTTSIRTQYCRNLEQKSGKAKKEKHKEGESGKVTCPGKAFYTTEKSSISYVIEGKDVTVNCYYTKDIIDNEEEDNTVE